MSVTLYFRAFKCRRRCQGVRARVRSACCVSTTGERVKPTTVSRAIVNAPCSLYDPKIIGSLPNAHDEVRHDEFSAFPRSLFLVDLRYLLAGLKVILAIINFNIIGIVYSVQYRESEIYMVYCLLLHIERTRLFQ